MSVLLTLILLIPVSLFAQQQQRSASSYEVLSSTASELVVRVAPTYRLDTLTTEHGQVVRVDFSGGIDVNPVGAPGELKLLLPILLPGNQAPAIETLSEQHETVSGIDLAPVATHVKRDGIVRTTYIRDVAQYAASSLLPVVKFIHSGMTRTAYSGTVEVNAVRREGGRIQLVKELILRITFSGAGKPATVGTSETDFFRTTFINGNVAAFYRSAAAALTSTIRQPSLGAKRIAQAGEEKWVAIKTTEEGVYRITAEQLAQYGISNADASTIALYGYGAKMVPEGLDSITGELAEVAIDVRTSGGSFRELRFYAPGMHDWRYSPEPKPSWTNDQLWQIYHMTNPYSSSGHFMLKVGGNAAERRVIDNADEVSGQPAARDKVPVVVVQENELNFEYPNYSREFVGEPITRGVDININLPQLPGYTSEATYIRPATNSRAESPHTFEFKINGSVLGTTSGRTIADLAESPFYSLRNWDAIFPVQGTGVPATLTISAISSEKQPQYWLNFIEIYYQRTASLSSGAIPFFLANDSLSYRLTIADAANAELWDISSARKPFRLAVSSGAAITTDLQAPGQAMRRFIAFRESDLRTPELSSTNVPSLRSGLGQNGAEMIVVVPEAYKDQGERLAEQRRRGGQATGPISVAVVTVEDIYKEFAYGAKDVTAIRDFLAYTLRHTTATGKTVPSFVTLFGKGHTDYQNRKTQLPLHIPVYETNNFGSLQVYRREHPEYVPDDAFFVKLVPKQGSGDVLDMAPGRITVRDADEAKVYVDKVIRYETSSEEGSWRARTVFIADDRYWTEGTKGNDPLPHINDTENEIKGVDKRLTIEKVYGVTYPNTFTSSGQRLKPQQEETIVNAFNTGAVLISFVGHGNPNVWTHESILKVPSTINKLSNLNRLAYLTTATCDFTAFDNYDELSGGVMLLIKSDGGIIGSLGTCRSVYADEELVEEFYKKLFDVSCSSTDATTPVGFGYVAGRKVGSPGNANKFFILGDPSQRLLIPRQHVIVESINGAPYNDAAQEPFTMKALSKVTIAGYIASKCDGSDFDEAFNGTTTLTLRDAPTNITQTTVFTDEQGSTITDRWNIEGPILYRGTATVKNGRFSATFIVPKDIKFDSLDAKLQMLAYSDDFRSALGAATNIQVFGIDTTHAEDNEGPKLTIYIGNRRFSSGDVVPVYSKIIVDVEDSSGLNTSTSSIGHSFAGWVNDATSSIIDLSESYVSRQDDYKGGTAEQQTQLPLGKNVLHVRAFDALNNQSEATVEFIARDGDPYEIFDVALSDNPVHAGTTFSFLQPSSPQNPVDVTINLYTSDGRKVRSLSANGVTVNDVKVYWDVRDDEGSFVPDGAYIYHIQIADRLSGEAARAGGVFHVLKLGQ